MSLSAKQPNFQQPQQAGFTIVELMISMLVFSLVLILITVGVLSFTKSYYQGINQSKTQTTARTILETITQAIQFSGDTVTPPGAPQPNGSNSFCIGNQQYSFILNKQLIDDDTLGPNQSHHGLILNKNNGLCDATPPQDMSADKLVGTELLTPQTRLAKLAIDRIGTSDTYRVTIRVIYGDDDLLVPDSLNTPDSRCQTGISGSQYCAQAELTTVVRQRITN